MRWLAFLAVGLLAAASGAHASQGAGGDRDSWETVVGAEETSGHAWTSGYDARVEGERIRVRLGIQLVPAAGVARPELEGVMPRWQGAIEAVWGGRFAVATADGLRRVIDVEVDLRGPRFHHQVVVRPGRGRTDQLNWYLADSDAVVAHEAGHMLGAFDDYRGGATGEVGRVDDRGSVMAADPRDGAAARARHLEGVRAWLAAKTGTNARIVAVEQNENASDARDGEVDAGLASNSGAGPAGARAAAGGGEERGRR